MVPINTGYDYTAIDSIDVAKQLLKECHTLKLVSYDIETTGLELSPNIRIRTIAFCTGYPNKRYVHIVGDYKLESEQIIVDDSKAAFIQNKKERDYVTNFLVKFILNNKEIAKVGWNLKFDNAHIERVFGYKVEGKVLDGFLMKKLLSPDDKGAGLKNTTIEMLDESYHNYEDAVLRHLNGKRKTKESVGELFRTVDAVELCGYNAIDTEVSLIITDQLYTRLKAFPSLENLYNKIVDPLSRVLTDVELKGMCVDTDLVETHIKNFEEEVEALKDYIGRHYVSKRFFLWKKSQEVSDFNDSNPNLVDSLVTSFWSIRKKLSEIKKYTPYRKDVFDTACAYFTNRTEKSLDTWSSLSDEELVRKLYKKKDYEELRSDLERIRIDVRQALYLQKNLLHYNKSCKEINKAFQRRRKKIKKLLLSSPAQLVEYIYYDGGIGMSKILEDMGETLEEETTDVSTLKALPFEKSEFPDFLDKILALRGMEKAISTYLKVLRDNCVPHADGTHRIHGTFKIGGTETGRLSSANPNLQNIPRAGSKTGAAIKSCIVAPKGYKLMQIDFSQMELRMLALASFDKHMMNIYASGEDLHKFAAMSILDVNDAGWEEIDKQQKKKARTMAKAVNFGYMYGMGPKKFKLYAKNSYGVDFTIEEAEQLQTKFFTAFPSIVRYYVQLKQMVYEYIENYKTIPYIFNMFGRMRPLLRMDYNSFNRLKQEDKNSYIASACRNAINTVIQSSCADLMMLFMIQFHERVDKLNSMLNSKKIEIVNTVHDSIILYVPDEYIEYVYKLGKTLIQNPTWLEDFGVPFDKDIIFEVDFEIGDSWADLREYEYIKEKQLQ